ncbi:hypothetical protein ACF063_41635 [Streptomyces chartreusis]|uniref:hypothetical protein n=1 Tax=Streptomyces chartreusis TaxID=1969 RepID=UPI0037008FD7
MTDRYDPDVAEGERFITAMGGCTVLDCRVRVVRGTGWSWGPDPAELARGAVALLPRAVHRYLVPALAGAGVPGPPSWPAASGEAEDPARLEVTVPVRITVRVTLRELTDAGRAASDSQTAAVRWPDDPSAPRPGVPTPRAGRTSDPEPYTVPVGALASAGPGSEGRSGAASPHERDRVLVSLLSEAWDCGVFDAVLARLPRPSLLLLLRALESAGAGAGPVPGALRPVSRDDGLSSDGPVHPADGPVVTADDLTSALLAVLDAAESADAPESGTSDSHLEAAAGPGEGSRPGEGLFPGPQGDAAAPGGPPRAAARGCAPYRSRPTQPGDDDLYTWHRRGPAPGTVTEIDCALPFLLLPALDSRGYLTALSAVLAGGEPPGPDGTAFAAALAHKVLPPPGRGWLRAPQDAHSASVFAGLFPSPWGPPESGGRAEPGPGPEAASSPDDLEHRLGSLLALLDVRLGVQSARGHDPGRPLLLTAGGPERLLLLDVDGLYPVWDAARPEELRGPWELAGRPLVLLPRLPSDTVAQAVAPGLLVALDESGIGYVTDLPPARGEAMRRVPGRLRCWTNAGAGSHAPEVPSDALIGGARRLAHEAARADRFTDTLISRRPCARPGQAPALDRTVTLAAASALADLAWTLWADQEAPHPATALDRFADLGARVLFHDGTVEVRLPLGARHTDLHRHRLLADVPAVPWLAERRVTFTGG